MNIGGEIAEYDFDEPVLNPIDYRRILENWNLLNTVANTFGMFFEGNCDRYNTLYDLLFRLNTPIGLISPRYDIGEKNRGYILKIFKKKNRFLSKFQPYNAAID